MAEDALSYELALDLDNLGDQRFPGDTLKNRIISTSLLVSSRLRQIGSKHLAAQINLARAQFNEPTYLIISRELAESARVQRGCQMRVDAVPVFAGTNGFYLLATRESELTLAVCENPIPKTAELSDDAPKKKEQSSSRK